MSEKQAKATRRELRAQGIDPFEAGKPNFTDRPDTREQRRTKTFRKKAFAVQEKQASVLEMFKHRIKWNRAFSALKKAS